jgi:hypothetical protein
VTPLERIHARLNVEIGFRQAAYARIRELEDENDRLARKLREIAIDAEKLLFARKVA